MPVMTPALADPEIAAATLKQDVERLWATGRPAKLGWEISWRDPLNVLVKMRAVRPEGPVDDYYFLLGGEYYDAAPPTVALVDPHTLAHARLGSKWFPEIQNPPWFGLHDAYAYPTQGNRQLLCFTFAAEYYMTDHSPKETEKWQQGRHTVAATLYRLQEVLSPPFYKKPTGS